MAITPTYDQLQVLRSVEQSSAGIDAILDRDEGLDCVRNGWLRHREHRREEGGVIDVWELTAEGRDRLVLARHQEAA
jgi:hypothetical protein